MRSSDQDRPRRRVEADPDPRTNTRPRERSFGPMQAAQAGLRQITDLTGREVQGVVSLEPAEGGWVVGIEVVEDRRIPSSTDVLALYEAEIDSDGQLLAYSRKRRYPRGKSDRGEAGG
jgi:hypothetical protein